mmetsp:Transcript_48369/g.121881  ORF Transcript_48369/g.121881 Transcript_48369/m.121881 type:complete len:678 (-) Transcript_48369:9-2042(-)
MGPLAMVIARRRHAFGVFGLGAAIVAATISWHRVVVLFAMPSGWSWRSFSGFVAPQLPQPRLHVDGIGGHVGGAATPRGATPSATANMMLGFGALAAVAVHLHAARCGRPSSIVRLVRPVSSGRAHGRVQARQAPMKPRAAAEAPTSPASGTGSERLTGITLAASLKMRCDSSGADYAIYWVNVDGQLTTAGYYVTPPRRAALEAQGKTGSFAEVSQSMRLPAQGCKGPISTVYNLGTPICIGDAASNDTLNRKDLAAEYGVQSICFVPCEGGVLEYGTSTTTWAKSPPATPNMPKKDIRRAFENLGASYVMFWAEESGQFRVIADYACENWVKSIRSRRGDDKTFCSESKLFKLDASGDGPIATAARLGIELHINIDEALTMKRAGLAREFGIKAMHVIPVPGGVLECGISDRDRLAGHVLNAALKMRCDIAGSGYAIYWTEVDGLFVVSGDYVTPERRHALRSQGLTTSFADASRHIALSSTGTGPVATCARHGQPTFVRDAKTCTAMARHGLAAEYGIESVCCIPVLGGVVEFGTSVGSETASWADMPDCPEMPKLEMRKAFDELGAVYVIFWQLSGDSYVVAADYVTPDHERTMRNRHGNDVSFCSLSRMFALPADGPGYVARAARSGKEFVIADAASDPMLLRQKLAQQFGIGEVHIVPVKGGVLEYGMARG